MDRLAPTLEEHPSESELQFVLDQIRQFNREVSGQGPPRSVACFVRDDDQQIVGGVRGDIWGTSIHIAALWVAESQRGKDYGSEILKAVEDYAAAAGCTLSYVETVSFQARPFYEKCGYQIFGELPGIAAGCTLYFLRKDLAAHISGAE